MTLTMRGLNKPPASPNEAAGRIRLQIRNQPNWSRYRPAHRRLWIYQQQQSPAEMASSCSSVMFGSGGKAICTVCMSL